LSVNSKKANVHFQAITIIVNSFIISHTDTVVQANEQVDQWAPLNWTPCYSA